ncbi:MAG: homoserine kinase [Bacillota bacterium]|jgi:homoserine kinase|nr:homoserine kinase [Bacillota bacterium]
MSKKVTVKVPATTANLGPGFDSLGMALNLYNTVVLEEAENLGCEIEIVGEGETFLPRDTTNLVFRAVETLAKRACYRSRGWKLRLENRIPLQRGLGSSAAAIVGGLIAANSITGNRFTSHELLLQAIEIEGHPDNVVAALFGGVVVVVEHENSYLYTRFFLPQGLKVYAVVPDFPLATKTARSVLPETVFFKDAVFNLARVALLTAALREGNWDLLSVAVQDRLHQPYRSELIPGFKEVLKAAHDAGAYGAFLSGAGPAVIALAPPGSKAGEAMKGAFRNHGFEAEVWNLEPSQQGAHVLE